MCHAVPARVVEVLDASRARVEIGGVRSIVCTELVGAVAVNDYLVVHVGFAIGRLDTAEAEATLALLAALGQQAPA